MADERNQLIIEVEVDPDGRATVALKGLEGDVNRFGVSTDKAGQSGLRLRDIFTGNLLSDFFQRGVAAAVQFGTQTVQAAALASDANRQLEFSATQAGLSYTRAAELAEDFGRRVGASNTQAAATFADIVRLAERAGRAGEIGDISREFADLSAARGIRGAELQSLIGTILSGQDEGLNRLGIDDPGKLNAAYAASLGKTAEALTQTEKAQAALNAVRQKALEAEGQAEARLRSTAGQLDTSAAAYENLKTQIGESITNSVEFRDALDLVSQALGAVTTSHAQARRELAQGLKTPEQIAQEERDARAPFNIFKGAASFPFSTFPILADTAQLLTGRMSREDYRKSIEGTMDAVINPGQRQYEARVEQLRQLQKDIEQQEAEAKANAERASVKTAADASRAQLQATFSSNLDAAAKEENLDARLSKLRELKEELRGMPGVLDPTEFTKQSKKIDDAIAETAKQVASAARTARDAARDFLADAIAQAEGDNPLVKLFVRMQTEVEDTRRKFLIFGEDFASEMARIKKESIETEIAVARFQTRLQGLKYEQEARRLELPLGGLTGPEERRLDVINARVADILRGGDIERQIRQLNPNRPYTAWDERRDFNNQLLTLQTLNDSGAGSAGRKAVADAILELTGRIDQRTLVTSGDPVIRAARLARVDALRVQRDEQRRSLEDAIARERTGNLIQQDARELLAAVTASGLRDDARVREFLSVTGALSDRELTPDLRQARVQALREAARLESEKDRQGEERAKRLDDLVKALDAALRGKGIKVDAPPSNVRLNVGDGLTVDSALLGETPTADGPSVSDLQRMMQFP